MIEQIFKNILTVVYEQTGFAFVLAVLFMFFYLYAKEHGWRVALKKWWQFFCSSYKFRRMLIFAFYLAMLLFRTLFNRDMWKNPLSDLMGGWGLYNANRELTTESFENVILFIPVIVLIYWNFLEEIFKEKFTFATMAIKSILIALTFSLGIELFQLFFRVGTFQLSDLCYNTLGGLIGGFIYWGGYKVAHRNKKEKEDNIS